MSTNIFCASLNIFTLQKPSISVVKITAFGVRPFFSNSWYNANAQSTSPL
uniref:Uncharacterized protein n=1 Tax=Arundo donax TaxID=35708 RepID=A0A0A9BR47_ARUDO